MAVDPLEEKIIKIRQQNEEIRRRHEEVEADKKNAAKLNALVQMVPSSDWPERKEPPEFSAPANKSAHAKPRNVTREYNGSSVQYHAGSEGKKVHVFAQNDGPPPDPKYNFLADHEREEHYHENHSREFDSGKGRGKSRQHTRKRGSGREWQSKEYHGHHGPSTQDAFPDYEAWRAERDKIDEARINRQRTAEGNWKREWDNDKMDSVDEDRYSREYSRNSHYFHPRDSNHDRRISSASERNQPTVNHGSSAPKSSLMSVKVSSANIAGTGRVGPRQRTRIMYSSQSDNEIMNFEVGNFNRQKSFDGKAPTNDSNATKGSNSKNVFSAQKKDTDKSPYVARREYEKSDVKLHRRVEGDVKSPSLNKKDFKNFQKSPHAPRRSSASNNSAKSARSNRKAGEVSSELTRQRVKSESSKIITSPDTAVVSTNGPQEADNAVNPENYPLRPENEAIRDEAEESLMQFVECSGKAKNSELENVETCNDKIQELLDISPDASNDTVDNEISSEVFEKLENFSKEEDKCEATTEEVPVSSSISDQLVDEKFLDLADKLTVTEEITQKDIDDDPSKSISRVEDENDEKTS